MKLYIRHGEKEYKNGRSETFSLDPGLTKSGIVKARHKIKSLIQEYFIPDKIICSPYLRTRETAQLVQEMIYSLTNKTVNIFYDIHISECLANSKHIKLKDGLRKETLELKPRKNHSMREFNENIIKHMNDSLDCTNYNTWYVTHGLVIQTIAKNIGYIIKHPKEVCGILLPPVYNKIELV